MGRPPHLVLFSVPGDNNVDAAREPLTALGIAALADAS
jgi:hypothetical protein